MVSLSKEIISLLYAIMEKVVQCQHLLSLTSLSESAQRCAIKKNLQRSDRDPVPFVSHLVTVNFITPGKLLDFPLVFGTDEDVNDHQEQLHVW